MIVLINYSTCAVLLSVWTSGDALNCDKSKRDVNGKCCDLCPPGHYMIHYCTNQRQTQCSPCPEGFYLEGYNLIDRCKECNDCQQEFSAKCTPTTNANCSCRSGFLCSDSSCTSCQENKCAAEERAVRAGLTDSYHCEACQDHEYLDVNIGTCRPITKCQTLGQEELFPGNATHDSICAKHDDCAGQYYIVVLGVGFGLVSIILIGILIHICAQNMQKQKAKKPTAEILWRRTSTYDYHLSKEESGIELKLKDESNFSGSQLQLQTLVLV